MSTVRRIAVLLLALPAVAVAAEEPAVDPLSWRSPASSKTVLCVDHALAVPPEFRKPLGQEVKTFGDLMTAVHTLTGLPVSFAASRESGEEPLSMRSVLKRDVSGVPICEALDQLRAESVLWWIDEQGVHVIQDDNPCSLVTSTITCNISGPRAAGLDRACLIDVIIHAMPGPWMQTDGEGGEITAIGDSLWIQNDPRSFVGVKMAIAMLAAKEREVYYDQPPVLVETLRLLDKPVSLDLHEATRQECRRELDRLSEGALTWPENSPALATWESNGPVTRTLLGHPLISVLDEVGPSFTLREGRLALLEEDEEERRLMVAFNVERLTHGDRRKADWLAAILMQRTTGPWEIIDGEGAESILVLSPNRLLIQQTFSTILEIRNLMPRMETLFAQLPANLDDSSPEAREVLDDIKRLLAPPSASDLFFGSGSTSVESPRAP